MYENWVAATLDGHDPYYKWKLARQIVAKRFLERITSGFWFKDDLPKFAQDAEEFKRRSQETPNGLRRQLTELGNEIHDLNQKIDRAQTLAEQKKLKSDRELARKQEKDVAKRYRKVMETQPDAERVAVAESTRTRLYQQARTECGGYDTCVTDRVAKLRDQKKTTTATATTRTGQHKQSQKKTQTPDYRGKGGVKASAA
ncbi:hypothetical protein ACFU98_38035 [Streptomyces sp. NPDC057575]|uniref:hypothetical protein n=1 Tax=unclassified Streptomyces TaxID=2593676 RepID=UPI003674EA43